MSLPDRGLADTPVISVQKSNLEARLELASVLEDMGRKSEALDLVSDGELRSSDPY